MSKKQKGRGGKRLGAGSKPTWKLGKTKTIRVPCTIAAGITEIAREIDAGALNERDAIVLIQKAIVCVRAESDF